MSNDEADTEISAAVRAAVAQLLGGPDVAGSDNFFELGGHSMLAAQLLRALEPTLGFRPALRHVFEAVDLDELSARLSADAEEHARR